MFHFVDLYFIVHSTMDELYRILTDLTLHFHGFPSRMNNAIANLILLHNYITFTIAGLAKNRHHSRRGPNGALCS